MRNEQAMSAAQTWELEAYRQLDKCNSYATLIGGIQSLVRDARAGVPLAISNAIALFETIPDINPEQARVIVQRMIKESRQ